WYQLKQIQENSEYSDLNILNIVETRWLSWANVINNFHQIIEDVHSALIQHSDNNPIAKFLADSLDTEFYIFTKFLADILGTISSMIKIFQSDYVTLSETRHQLSMIIETITSDFIGTEFFEPYYGNHLSKFMNENLLTSSDLPED
ncbi:14923_t:CDS:2, partial [Funneliformis caledonium]